MEVDQLSAQQTTSDSAIKSASISVLDIEKIWKDEDYSPLFFKQAIQDYRANQLQKFISGEEVTVLIPEFSAFIDKVLECIWKHLQLDQFEQLSLIAVGGYGRNELLPQSDIDILILKQNDRFKKADEQISQFVTQLWDLGLDIGSSVRSIKDCYREAKDDITIATNIMEARTIIGSATLLEKMQHETRPKKIWGSVDFFSAKRQEQNLRHKKHNNTEYNLEPDIKEAPGGLRDIQMISWVAKRHYNCNSLYALVENGFIEEEEFTSLVKCQNFLWKIRFALHALLDKPENKLLFDHQKMLAEHFSYKDTEKSLAIEQFMKEYYRAAVEVSELNNMLLQHFDDHIINRTRLKRTITINKRFKLRKGYLETTSDTVFLERPSALIEVFVIAAQNKNIEDFHIRTIRQIRKYRHIINEDFRNDVRNTSLFIELLNSPYKLFTQLERMKLYGVLGAYIPEFAAIIGQMQYDLFHIYTVDAHTLLLIKNLRRFRLDESRETFPLAHNIFHSLPKLAPLYIAAIFHDIGKGSGQDHSELGAKLVIPFMKRHGFGEWDTELVSWMVKSHLLMSMITQRKDLADPQVIEDFAEYVGNSVRLDYLYALTVADVNATNPTLWNGWKASLYRELYTKTKQLFRSGAMPNDNVSLIQDRKDDALNILNKESHSQEALETFWESLDDDYFIRHNGIEIAWQSDLVLNHHQANTNNKVLAAIKTEDKKHIAQTQIFTYTPDAKNLFAATVTLLNQLGLSVLDARIMSSKPYLSDSEHSNTVMALNTYVVLSKDNKDLNNTENQKGITSLLEKQLANTDGYAAIVENRNNKKLSRQVKQFDLSTHVKIEASDNNQFSVVEIRTLDRPGLLASIGAIFMHFNLAIHNARIATLGETVEDMFFVSFEDKSIEDEALCQNIKNHIEKTLEEEFIAFSSPEKNQNISI